MTSRVSSRASPPLIGSAPGLISEVCSRPLITRYAAAAGSEIPVADAWFFEVFRLDFLPYLLVCRLAGFGSRARVWFA